jgi:hypothetical protein
MKVDVQVQAGAKSLNEVDRTALCGEHAVALRRRAVAGEDRLDEDAPERREHVGLEGGEPAQLEGQRQDVLAHGDIGKDSVRNGRRGVRHRRGR